ncbi:MAG: O-phosphoserine--tRNA ligase [Candidatus Jordarchaeales archaeon]|nr:O-phosphoserine--tRNA ligase [Candidatus Jordarchaeia archaeon]
MRFNIKKLLERAEEDYEAAWVESRELLKLEGRYFRLKPLGRSNEIMNFIEEVRKTLVEMGFEEVVLPVIVDESEVRKEYGPEATIILDRVFYLAGLPRPDVGLSKEDAERIKELVPSFNEFEKLREILRKYKKRKIEADDLVETMVNELSLQEEDATRIIDTVFHAFKNLTPVPSPLTLRSHMTALWFPVLSAIYKYKWKELPVQLFTVGQKFRREQKIDPTHLYSSYTASFVIMTEEISLEDGKSIVQEFLGRLGFSKAEFRLKKATSKYYAPQTEFEVFIQHPETSEWIEVGDCGFYSPVSLAKYDIDVPVFNAGFGIERFVMIRTGETDVRRLTYPYFYRRDIYSDEEIAEGICYAEKPETELGEEIMNSIISVAEEHMHADAPCKFTAWKGKIDRGELTVTVFEEEKGVKLLGPAALNVICIHEGNILGLPPSEVRGTVTKLRYLDGVAALFARKVEKEILEEGKREVSMKVRMAKKPSDVNIYLSEQVRRYISSKNKRIDIRGPVFISLAASLNDS